LSRVLWIEDPTFTKSGVTTSTIYIMDTGEFPGYSAIFISTDLEKYFGQKLNEQNMTTNHSSVIK
jgi:hypothetical protein